VCVGVCVGAPVCLFPTASKYQSPRLLSLSCCPGQYHTMVCRDHTCVFLLPALHAPGGWVAGGLRVACCPDLGLSCSPGSLHATRKPHCRQCFYPQIIACQHLGGEQQSDGCVSVCGVNVRCYGMPCFAAPVSASSPATPCLPYCCWVTGTLASLRLPFVWQVGASLGLVKLARYTFMLWIPTYLQVLAYPRLPSINQYELLLRWTVSLLPTTPPP
jgi:hypothetical protein